MGGNRALLWWPKISIGKWSYRRSAPMRRRNGRNIGCASASTISAPIATRRPSSTWRGLALDEFTARMELNPGLSQAQTDLDHLLNNRNMLGIARDVDIFPDFDRYDSFVTTSSQLIQSLLLFANNDLTVGVLQDDAAQSLQAEIAHLQASINILGKEEQAAALDQQIAAQEKADSDQQVKTINQQLEAAKDALDHASITLRREWSASSVPWPRL